MSPPPIPLLTLVAVLALPAWPAAAATVRGTVLPPASDARAVSRGTGTALPDDLQDAVVYLLRVPKGVEHKLTHPGWFHGWFLGWFSSDPPLPRVTQVDQRFSPRVSVVAESSLVEFANRDHLYHNVFSVAVARRFDLGKRAPGCVDTVSFDRPGVVTLHCDIHPDEIGYIVVTPNHAFSRPDREGRFELPNLPRGRYDLCVWHPRLGELHRRFVVPRHGDVTLTLEY